MKHWGVPESEHTAAVAAIRDVLVGYCHCIDQFDDAALLQLFTPHGEWLRPGKNPLRGRAEIAVFLADRDRSVVSRHVVSNTVVEMSSPDQARAISYYTVLKAAPHSANSHACVPAVLGEYHDQFRLEQGRWRIAWRDTRHVFRAG
jgi:ketosteroid isomerase-like protein